MEMTVTRRVFLRIVGSSAVVLAAGCGGFALTRTPQSALAPWQDAGQGYEDARLEALSYAILAPNPHNRQPWMVELIGEDEIALYCDLERLLPETDPFNRQIVIGLGCFLEILHMAAAEAGNLAEIKPFPEGADPDRLDKRPVARIRMSKSPLARRDPLFASVPLRRSNKAPFDTQRDVPATALADLRAAAGKIAEVATSSDSERVAALRDLTWRAMQVELTTENTYMESVELMRIGKAEIEANPDGIDLGGVFLESLNLVGALTREELADMGSSAFEQGLEMMRQQMQTAMAHVWVVTPDDSRLAQLRAGRAWVRINLSATAQGLGLHPLSQALQEYPEMNAHYEELHGRLGIGGQRRIQMLGRIGYGEAVAPSPRWPLTARLMPT